jgi:hypothetical protein
MSASSESGFSIIDAANPGASTLELTVRFRGLVIAAEQLVPADADEDSATAALFDTSTSLLRSFRAAVQAQPRTQTSAPGQDGSATGERHSPQPRYPGNSASSAGGGDGPETDAGEISWPDRFEFARAAGVAAAQRLQGFRANRPVVPSSGLQPTVYLALRDKHGVKPVGGHAAYTCWAAARDSLGDVVRSGRGYTWVAHRDSVFQGFPTSIEAEAFLEGAGLQTHLQY